MQTAMTEFAEAEEWLYSFPSDSDCDKQAARVNYVLAAQALDLSRYATGFYNDANPLADKVQDRMLEVYFENNPAQKPEADADWQDTARAQNRAREALFAEAGFISREAVNAFCKTQKKGAWAAMQKARENNELLLSACQEADEAYTEMLERAELYKYTDESCIALAQAAWLIAYDRRATFITNRARDKQKPDNSWIKKYRECSGGVNNHGDMIPQSLVDEGWFPYNKDQLKRVNPNTNRYEYMDLT